MRWTILASVFLFSAQIFSVAESTPLESSSKQASPYCAINPKHTMCLYPGPSAACKSMTIMPARKMNDATKVAILANHNTLRSQVALGKQAGQPPAANMMKLTWNPELEVIAQRWADQCIWDHDANRDTLSKMYVGQNLYMSKSSASGSDTAVQTAAVSSVQSWYDEVTKPGFSSASINPFVSSSGTGHYTQVAWAKTTQIGCGMVYFYKAPWYTTVTVCNYAVGGNMVGGGSSMYITGTACSKCPAGTKCTSASEGLCA